MSCTLHQTSFFMKSLLLLLAFCLIPLVIVCQSKNENVIVSSGNTIISSEGSMDWVIGENLIDHQVLFGNSAPEDVFQQLKNQAFVAYPTLTPDKVYIVSKHTDWNNMDVEVYDVSNKRVLIQTWDKNPMEVDLTGVTSGLYIIRLIKVEQPVIAVFKVVKQ